MAESTNLDCSIGTSEVLTNFDSSTIGAKAIGYSFVIDISFS